MKKRTLISAIEVTVAILLLVLLDKFVFDGTFLTINPSPYLLLCVLAAAFYGSLFGALSSFAVFFLNRLFVLPRDAFFEAGILWPFAGIFILSFLTGMIRDILNERIVSRDNEIKLKSSRIESQEEIIENLKDVGDEMIRRLYFESESIGYLIKRLNDSSELDSERILSNALSLLYDFTQADVISLYIKSENSQFLRKILFKGPSMMPNTLKIEDSKMITLAAENGFSSLNDEIMEQITTLEPWIVCAINRDQTEERFAFIVIESLSYEKMNEQIYQYIKLVARWLEITLRNALAYEANLKKEYRNDDGTWNISQYERIANVEKHRFERYEIPYWELKCESGKDLGEKLVTQLRAFDFVFKRQKGDQYTYSLFLTNTKKEDLNAIITRLEKSLPDIRIKGDGYEGV